MNHALNLVFFVIYTVYIHVDSMPFTRILIVVIKIMKR
jgi:hypothetical protein